MLLKVLVIIVCFSAGGVLFGVNSECDVTGTTVDCSGRNLTHIPSSVPSNVTRLIFRFNRLTKISDDTLSRLTRIEYVDFTFNDISVISDDAFSELLNLTNITLAENRIEKFNMSAFRNQASMVHVNLSVNYISQLHLQENISVRILTLNENKISFFNGEHCRMPALKELYLRQNDILYLKPGFFTCFPNVRRLNLSENPVRRISSDVFSDLHDLSVLELNNMCGLREIDERAFNNSNLGTISLRYNNLAFKSERNSKLSNGMFCGCENVEDLALSGNNMMKFEEKDLKRLLDPVKNSLQRLHMSNCILLRFPHFLSEFPEIRHIGLTGNDIHTLNISCYPKKLQYLSLKDNDLTSANELTLPDNLTGLQINLARNPFACTCELLWFLELFEATWSDDTFCQHNESYTCASPSGLQGTNLTEYSKTVSLNKCLVTTWTSLLIISFFSFAVIVIILGTVLYHYRWHFRYFLYMLRSTHARKKKEDEEEYTYDVFVAYADEDLKWILEQAIPNLEEREHFHLCIHQRDFELGALLVDSFVDCVNSSKKFIILISNHFAKSQWCKFCLALIQRQIRSQCLDITMVVKLGDIELRHMSPSLFDLLTTVEYIEWSADSRAVGPFWERLVHFVKKRPVFVRAASSQINTTWLYRRMFSDGSILEKPPRRSRTRLTC